MTYLDIARAVVYDRREMRIVGYGEGVESTLRDEKNEENEKSSNTALLTPEEAERLNAQIVAAVTADSTEFDRDEYDRLWARRKSYEADRAGRPTD